MRGMKQKRILRVVAVLLVASLVCGACGGSVNMHKHKRSHCDCPSF